MYLDKFDLSGRVAVVTGGGRNIGLACAHALAEGGARVIITGHPKSDTLESGRRELLPRGFAVEIVGFDITRSGEVDAAAQQVVARHGAVDILICNAGVGRGGTPAEQVQDELWLEMLDVNLTGVFWCCRAFGREMLRRGHGAIVNIGSISMSSPPASPRIAGP
jgi:NAD(P)-dependent dehydrogenase (short-subunit alcohol dehydrogenase family)